MKGISAPIVERRRRFRIVGGDDDAANQFALARDAMAWAINGLPAAGDCFGGTPFDPPRAKITQTMLGLGRVRRIHNFTSVPVRRIVGGKGDFEHAAGVGAGDGGLSRAVDTFPEKCVSSETYTPVAIQAVVRATDRPFAAGGGKEAHRIFDCVPDERAV